MTRREKSPLSGMQAETRFILPPAFPDTHKKAPFLFSFLSCPHAFGPSSLLLFCSQGVDIRAATSPLLSLHTSFISSLLNASLFSSALISPPPPSVSPLITTSPPHSCCLPSDAPLLLVAENERVLKPAAPLALLLHSSMPPAALSLSLSRSLPSLFFVILLFLSISVYFPPLAISLSSPRITRRSLAV